MQQDWLKLGYLNLYLTSSVKISSNKGFFLQKPLYQYDKIWLFFYNLTLFK
jgi:hypothetical protein